MKAYHRGVPLSDDRAFGLISATSRGCRMHDFEGDLLIGGMRLKHLHGELEQEGPEAKNGEWLLAGRLDLSPEEQKLLELNRRYRLQLEDGRAGQVVISNIE